MTISDGRHITMVYYEDECTGLEEVPHAFIQLQAKGFFCRSIKLFERGKLPSLEKYGYKGSFYMDTDKEIPIALEQKRLKYENKIS